MNAKVVTDFFGITTPEESGENENKVNNNQSIQVPFDGEEKVGEPVGDKEPEEQQIGLDDEEQGNDYDEESEEESDDDEDGDLQKLEGYTEKKVLIDYHPEVVQISEEELQTLSNIVKDKNGNIIDPFHRTIPILTKYEKAKIIGIRAQQINSGAEPFIAVDTNMIDGLTIAHEELMKHKIPFIIRRPMPNGASEYWNINDLEILE
jgi:DNA-directed RNA polymerase I, II, and III subunit RPABC2